MVDLKWAQWSVSLKLWKKGHPAQNSIPLKPYANFVSLTNSRKQTKNILVGKEEKTQMNCCKHQTMNANVCIITAAVCPVWSGEQQRWLKSNECLRKKWAVGADTWVSSIPPWQETVDLRARWQWGTGTRMAWESEGNAGKVHANRLPNSFLWKSLLILHCHPLCPCIENHLFTFEEVDP